MKKLLLFLSGVIVGYLLVNLHDMLSKPATHDGIDDGMWDYDYLNDYPNAWDADYLEVNKGSPYSPFDDTQPVRVK